VGAVFEAFGFLYFFSGSSQLEFDPNAKKSDPHIEEQ
jgi:matrix metalloproteinase-3 (stromelysin 1)